MRPGTQFKVVLEGTILPEFERGKVQEGLAELFHSSEETMERLLQGQEVALKKQYDRDQAATICQKIRQIGVQCRFEEISGEETAPVEDAARARGTRHPCPVCRNQMEEFEKTCPVCGFVEREVQEVEVEVDDEGMDYIVLDRRDAQEGGRDESGSPARGMDSAEDSPEENGASVDSAGADSGGDDSREQTKADRLQELFNRHIQTNTAYYERQFARFGSPEQPRFAISWHWPAFFFFFFWALYRKLWFWAGVNLTLSLGLSLFIQPGMLYLFWALAWPMVANYLYFRVVSSRVQWAIMEPGYEPRLDALGGVSRPAAGLGVLIFIFAVIFTGNHLTDRFIDQYGEQIQEVLPQSGSQIRGDGSPLEPLVDRQSKLALTSLKLSYLGTSLKILILAEDNSQNRGKIATFERQFTNQRVADSWGQPLQLEQQVGRYVLKSAGPDRAFNTDDDILQLVTHQSLP